MFNEEFEKTLIEAIKEAVDDSAVELFSDMTRDNPDWWSEKLVKVFTDTVKKALKDEELVTNILREIFVEFINDIDLEVMASEIIEEKIKSSILNKITVEVKND